MPFLYRYSSLLIFTGQELVEHSTRVVRESRHRPLENPIEGPVPIPQTVFRIAGLPLEPLNLQADHLRVAQTRSVLGLIRRVAARGIGVVLISHNMPDVLEVADSIQVLRLGQRVASFRRGEADIADLVQAMTSGKLAEAEQ